MAFNVGEAFGVLTLDTSGFRNGIRSAMDDLRTLGDSSASFTDKMGAVGSALTSVGGSLTKYITVPLAGMAAGFVTTAAGFEQAMAEVKAISKSTGEDFDALVAKAEEMGRTTTFTSAQAAEALKYMAMAGWDTNDMLNSLAGVMALAEASGEDLGTVSDIVTDAMTAFGLAADGVSKVLGKDGLTHEVSNATRFVDVLAAASNNANTNVSMLGESFKYVAPVAGALGYSLEDTAVALGLMANNGIKASQAGTSLRAFLTRLSKPTKEVATAMDVLGVSLSDADGSMYSFMEIMQQLRQGFGQGSIDINEFQAQLAELDEQFEKGKLTEEKYEKAVQNLVAAAYGAEGAEKARLAAMLAGTEGMSGLLAIVNTSEDEFNKLTESIYKANGEAETMADTMKKTLIGQIKMLGSSVEGIAIAMGNRLLPIVTKVTAFITGLSDKFNALDDETKDTIAIIAAIAAAIGPVLLIGGKLITGISSAISSIGGLIAATGPLIPILAAVAAAVAGLYYAWTNNLGGIQEKTAEAIEKLRKTFDGIVTKLNEIWHSDATQFFLDGVVSEISDTIAEIMKSVNAFLEVLSLAWNSNFLGIQDIVQNTLSYIKRTFENTLTIIKNVFALFSALFQGDWQGAWQAVVNIFKAQLDNAKAWFELFLGNIVAVLRSIGDPLWTAATETFQRIYDGFMEKWNAIMAWLAKAKEDPITTLSELKDKLFELGEQIIDKFLEGLKKAWDKVTSWITEKVQWVQDKIAGAVSAVGGAASGGSSGGKLNIVPSWDKGTTSSGTPTVSGFNGTGTTRGQQITNNTTNITINSPTPLSPTNTAKQITQAQKEEALGASPLKK